MNVNDERNLSEQIIDIIDAAMQTQRFDTLNDQLSELLNPGGTSYRPLEHMMNGTSYYKTTYQRRQEEAMRKANSGRVAYDARRAQMMAGQPHNANMGAMPKGYAGDVRLPAAERLDPNLFRVPQGEETLGKVLGIVGLVALIVNGLRLGGSLLGFEGIGELLSSLIAFGVSGMVYGIGKELGNRIERFKKYASRLKQKMYAAVSDLSKVVGKSDAYTKRDLQKMIDKGMFVEGHLDDNQTTMIATNALYEQYRTTQEASKIKQEEKAARDEAYGEYSADVRKVLQKGDEYTKKIREANEAMPEEQITEKLTRLEMIISKIFAQVKKEPGEAKNLSQFMDYYLPTTWKLIQAYKEMDAQPVQGENITAAKKEILESLDTINDAFETLLDSMFKDKAWDVSTDISVMKSMMKQEGLMGSDFKAQGGAAAQVAPAKRTEPVKEEE